MWGFETPFCRTNRNSTHWHCAQKTWLPQLTDITKHCMAVCLTTETRHQPSASDTNSIELTPMMGISGAGTLPAQAC